MAALGVEVGDGVISLTHHTPAIAITRAQEQQKGSTLLFWKKESNKAGVKACA